MYSIGQFAEKIGVHPGTLRKWDRQGRLKAHRIDGGHRRYDDEHLKDAIVLLNPVVNNPSEQDEMLRILVEKIDRMCEVLEEMRDRMVP